MTPWRHRKPVPAACALPRPEYLRRGLALEAAVTHSPVGTGDLACFAATFGDLADPDVMSRAWQRAVMRVRAPEAC
jgi:hypothetical protein